MLGVSCVRHILSRLEIENRFTLKYKLIEDNVTS